MIEDIHLLMKICLLISIQKKFYFQDKQNNGEAPLFSDQGSYSHVELLLYFSAPLGGGGTDRNCPLKVNPHSNCLWIYGSCTVTVYFNSHFHCYFLLLDTNGKLEQDYCLHQFCSLNVSIITHCSCCGFSKYQPLTE